MTRPREVNCWVVCEETGEHAIKGVCPTHRGDGCLIVVGWVDNSHVRRDLAYTQARVAELESVLDQMEEILHMRPLPHPLGGHDRVRAQAVALPPPTREELLGDG